MLPQSEYLTPEIRHDIKLFETSVAEDGSKQWLIYDPVQNRYFTIGIDSFELLNHWLPNLSLDSFIEILERENYYTDIESLQIFIQFLISNNLIKASSNADAKKLEEQKIRSKQSPLKWLIHNYLFIKIPIFKPDKWLNRHYPKIEFMYSDLWGLIVLFLGMYGLVMILKEWSTFINTFLYFFSWEGAAFYGISLIIVKSLHELGHAFTAKRYGCKIPSIGMAFLVLMPVLYTDTTNAYQLKSKSKRLSIATAGIKVEIYLAMLCIFLWPFLENGTFKSIVFTTATTSLVASILINLSPFLRFDGYYALSDFTDIKNLQPRSFAYTRWFLRRYLTGIHEEPPEIFFENKSYFIVTYAIAVWIYRLVLFLGIAFLVYHFAFKVLGIILFIIEILWFIILPIFNELKIWWMKRNQMVLNRHSGLFVIFLVSFLFLIFYPWYQKVALPAVIFPDEFVDIYPMKNAKVVNVYIAEGDKVKKGDTLIQLESPELNRKIGDLKNELISLQQNLNLIAGNKKVLNTRFSLLNSIQKTKEELKGLIETQKSLIIFAPFNGEVHFNNEIYLGQYVNKKEPLLSIFNPKSVSMIAYCEENDIAKIDQSDSTVFIASNGEIEDIKASIESISKFSSSVTLYPELSSLYGGKIAVRESSNNDGNQLISESAYFKVVAKFNYEKYNIKFRIVGDLIVEGKPVSFANKLYLKGVNFIIKENCF